MTGKRPKHNYSDQKRVQVVTSYLALGKAPMVEAVTGVPAQTIRVWKMQQWWKDLVREIQTSEDQELDGKLTRVIDKSIDVINDRLEKGDFILDSKTGSIKRVPVKMRDSHRVATDLLDKRNVLRGKPTSITERVSTEDVLRKLAAQFQEFTKFQKTRLIEPDQVEYIEDAIPEERGTSIQEGVSLGEEISAQSSEATSSSEQGSPGDGVEDGTEYNGGCGPHPTFIQGGLESPLQLESSLPPSESFVSAQK